MLSDWTKHCRGIAILLIAIGITAILFFFAVCVLPAAGRAIDRAGQCEITTEWQYNNQSVRLIIDTSISDFSKKKDHSTVGAVSGHEIK